MPFVVEEIAEPAPIATGGVRISMRGKLRKTRLTIAKSLIDDLGWQDGDPVRMMVGTGEDAGTLRFERAAPGTKGAAKLRLFKAPKAGGRPYFVLMLGFVAWTPKGAKSMQAEACGWDVLGGTTLEVELPSSWQARPPEVTVTQVNGARKAIIDAARQAVPAPRVS